MNYLQSHPQLLVVEDNPGDFVLIEEYLAEGLTSPKITHVSTYRDAQKKLQEQANFDLVLLDLSLPDVSGEQLVKKMVEDAAATPIIVLTGYENQEFGLKTLSMGVADYVLKDEITPFVLSKVIAYSIERTRINLNLKESEKKYREIFNMSPQPMWVYDVDTLNFLDVNEAAVQQYGYSKDEFLEMTIKDIRPEKQAAVLEDILETKEKQERSHFEGTVKHQKKDGSVIDVRVKSQEIDYLEESANMVLAEDVTEKLAAERSLAQKSELLAANAKVASALIKNEDWLTVLNQTFDIIGKAVGADRVYYFENHTDEKTGQALTSQKIEWAADRVEPQIDNPELQDLIQDNYSELYSVLQQNKIFQSLTKYLPESRFKSSLLFQQIESILAVPIFVGGEFFGFIGFDDCKTERIWNTEEIQYLRTIASNISSAIKLRNTTGELRISEYKFKSMVEEGGDLIEILDENGYFKFVSPNLKKIMGWENEEMIGQNAFDFIHPDDVKIAREDFYKLADDDFIYARPFRFRHKDGKYKWLKCSASNLLDDDILNGVLITASDITEQKYYNELQKMERDVLEKNTLKTTDTKEIVCEFLLGIENLHSGIRTSVSLVKNNRIENYCSPNFPDSFVEDVDGVEVKENAGSCGAAAALKKQIIVPNIKGSPYWKGFEYLGEKYNFSASWSQPIFGDNDGVKATFAVYYDTPSEPTKYEHNTVERAAHILRILFDSEEKIQAERKLALREKRFKAMVQEGSDLIGILDKDFRFTYISPSARQNYEDYIGKKAISYIHPEDHPEIKEAMKKLPAEKRVALKPYRLKDKSGNYHWVETIVTNLLDEPAVGGYVANSRNITEQIEREEKLRELSLVAAKTTDAVIITDAEGNITWVNQAFEELTGYELNEIKGKRPGNFLQGEDTDKESIERLRKAVQNYESVEETILNYNKAGDAYWLNLSIDPIFDDKGTPTHFIAIERDVTEQIEKNRELQQSLERYDIVNKATSDTIWDLDLHSNKMIYNNNIYNMFGYTKKQVKEVGTWWRHKIHNDDLPTVDEKLAEVLKSGDERFQMEYRFKAADGSYKHIFDRAFVIKDETGKPVRMIGAMQDVTHEVEEEERLKLLESVITNTSESVVILNAKPGKYGREIVFTNEAFTRLTGYEKDEVLGETLHFLNGPDTDQQTRKKLKEAMEQYESVEVEFVNYRKDGEPFWINTSMVPVADNKGNYTHWVAIGRDITEQKNNEAEIKASLAEKETLLAEIHHRVKNNLAVVSGMMQLQAFDSDSKELQTKLYDSVVRIKTMATVHELLYNSNSFSQLEFSGTLRKLVENVSETLQLDSEVELDIECDPVKLNINQAIPASLIVNEVITNAYKHAFKGIDDGILGFRLRIKDELITVEVSDNGVGIPEKDRKENGNSSLGLHLIEVLSQQINAEYKYEQLDPGTRFILTFEKKETKAGIGNARLS